MHYISEENQLQYDQDIKYLFSDNGDKMLDYFQDNQNKTQYAVLFCVDRVRFDGLLVPCNFKYNDQTMHAYTIVYNITSFISDFLSASQLPISKDPVLAKLKQDVDNGFLKYYAHKRNMLFTPKLNMTLSSYPTTVNRFFKGADIVAHSGAFYFYFPPMIVFIVILQEIIREKELKLRKV